MRPTQTRAAGVNGATRVLQARRLARGGTFCRPVMSSPAPAALRRILAAAGATAALMLAGAVPSWAYASTSCSVDATARLSITKWAITGGQRYHLDLNSSSRWTQLRITFDGATITTGTNDQYRDVSGTGTHAAAGYWTTSDITTSCWRSL